MGASGACRTVTSALFLRPGYSGFRTERSGIRAKSLDVMTYMDSSVAVCILMHNSRLDCMRRVQPCVDGRYCANP